MTPPCSVLTVAHYPSVLGNLLIGQPRNWRKDGVLLESLPVVSHPKAERHPGKVASSSQGLMATETYSHFAHMHVSPRRHWKNIQTRRICNLFRFEATALITALKQPALSGKLNLEYYSVHCTELLCLQVGPVKTQRAPNRRNANGTIITLRANCVEHGWRRWLNHLPA